MDVDPESVPKEWIVPRGGKKEMIMANLQRDMINLELISRRYLLKWIIFFFALCSAIGGSVVVLWSQGMTGIFANFSPDNLKLGMYTYMITYTIAYNSQIYVIE